MTIEIPDSQLKQLVRAIEIHLGLNYPEDRVGDLVRAVTMAAPRLGCNDPSACVEWLLNSPHTADRVECLADYLTVGETYFFRDGKLFSAFEREVLPQLVRERRETGKKWLRIWSAGCASGEEPFSLAMVVKRAIPDLDDWDVTILATDINRRFLRKCKVGVYGKWSFRDAPSEITNPFFERSPAGYEISSEIRKMVRFCRLNLARDAFPDLSTDTHEMDVIFCRNVLMYFSQKRQQRVVERFSRCLSDRGWLVVSPAEASLVDTTQFEQAAIPGVVLFRKRSQQATEAHPFPISRHDMPSQLTMKTYPSLGQSPPLEKGGQGDFQVNKFEAVPHALPLQGLGRIEFPSEILSCAVSVETPLPVSRSSQEVSTDSAVEVDSCSVGLDLFRQGRYIEAANELRQALDEGRVRETDRAGVFMTLARAYANQGMLEQALEWCEKTFDVDKLNPEYHFLEATILEEMGDLARAQVSLNRALFLDPDLVVARFAMGNLARRQGRVSMSNRHYRIALEVLAGYDEAATLPGSDNLTAGRLIEAIQATMLREMAYEQS